VAEPLMAAGLPLVVVQPGLVYGPGDAGPAMETWRQYLLGKLRVIPARTAYAWTYIDDLVEGHIAAMDHGLPGTAYLMGGPNHTLAEAMAIAGRLTGIRAPKAVHPGLLAAGGAVADLAGRAGIGPGGELLRVLAGTTYIGDPARARRELGWNPRSLEAGLRTTLPPLAAQLGVTLPAFPEAA
jgi:nucleoside-diphosphate-sugar epimerase